MIVVVVSASFVVRVVMSFVVAFSGCVLLDIYLIPLLESSSVVGVACVVRVTAVVAFVSVIVVWVMLLSKE